jgi:hypothetical protein
VPEQRAYEVETIGEQAALIREAQELESYADPSMLHIALSRFYDHYNDMVRDHPQDNALYAYIKTLYVKAIEATR